VRRRTVIWLGVVLALAIGIGVGVASAVIPDSNGVAHACYDNKQGEVRMLVQDGAVCGKDETALDLVSKVQPRRYFRDSDTVFIPDANQFGSAFVFCDNNDDIAVSGGFSLVGNPATIRASRAVNGNNDFTGWKVEASGTGGGGGFQAHVVCLDFTP
jgi:hypothetical protein